MGMTMTQNTKCELCKTAEAEVLKFESEEVEIDEHGHTEIRKVPVLICLTCAEDEYDGTEEFPGYHPLEMALAA